MIKNMARDDKIVFDGKVSKVLPGTKFEVEVNMGNEKTHTVIATISGKLRQNFIRISMGDDVTVEISPYDLSKGIITWRDK
jgi:translation initiation factor IF-1